MNILAISLQGVGNAILITPALKYLSLQWHNLDVLVSNNSAHQLIASLGVARNVYVYNEKEGFVTNALRLRNTLKGIRYDMRMRCILTVDEKIYCHSTYIRKTKARLRKIRVRGGCLDTF